VGGIPRRVFSPFVEQDAPEQLDGLFDELAWLRLFGGHGIGLDETVDEMSTTVASALGHPST
jgi:hypothetical protein